MATHAMRRVDFARAGRDNPELRRLAGNTEIGRRLCSAVPSVDRQHVDDVGGLRGGPTGRPSPKEGRSLAVPTNTHERGGPRDARAPRLGRVFGGAAMLRGGPLFFGVVQRRAPRLKRRHNRRRKEGLISLGGEGGGNSADGRPPRTVRRAT